jgi:hypothetical protein
MKGLASGMRKAFHILDIFMDFEPVESNPGTPYNYQMKKSDCLRPTSRSITRYGGGWRDNTQCMVEYALRSCHIPLHLSSLVGCIFSRCLKLRSGEGFLKSLSIACWPFGVDSKVAMKGQFRRRSAGGRFCTTVKLYISLSERSPTLKKKQ